MNRKYLGINIFLSIIVGVCLIADVIFIGIMFYVKNDRYLQGDYPREYIQLDGVETTLLGSNYESTQAEPGYQFYEVCVDFTNLGDAESRMQYLGFYLNGKEYEDVIEPEYEELDTDAPFYYEMQAILPPGQSAPMKYVIQVKEGVEVIDAYVSLNLDDEGYDMDIFL